MIGKSIEAVYHREAFTAFGTQHQDSEWYLLILATFGMRCLAVVLNELQKGSELHKLARTSRYCLHPEALSLNSLEGDNRRQQSGVPSHMKVVHILSLI